MPHHKNLPLKYEKYFWILSLLSSFKKSYKVLCSPKGALLEFVHVTHITYRIN